VFLAALSVYSGGYLNGLSHTYAFLRSLHSEVPGLLDNSHTYQFIELIPTRTKDHEMRQHEG